MQSDSHHRFSLLCLRLRPVLHVTVRRVQQLLGAAEEPGEVISLGSKQRPRKLRAGDWRGLLKATERRTAQVFGSVEDPKRLAGAIAVSLRA